MGIFFLVVVVIPFTLVLVFLARRSRVRRGTAWYGEAGEVLSPDQVPPPPESLW